MAPRLGTFGNWVEDTGLILARVASGLVVDAASAFDALVRERG